MKTESRRPFRFDTSVLDQLACPACLGGLSIEGEQLVCALCARVYPILDGIPVLIARSEAKPG
jgi:uncharacterized protein YbaR (Trm112 family)